MNEDEKNAAKQEAEESLAAAQKEREELSEIALKAAQEDAEEVKVDG